MRWVRAAVVLVAVLSGIGPAPPAIARGPELTGAQKQELDRNWQLVVRKRKGPYTQNYCVCRNGERQPVMLPDGRIQTPCGGAMKFCSAWREPWAEAIANHGMYVGNLFARDLFEWDQYEDHHDLVRGYVLEKFFVETHPDHKLAQMRAYGGLAGAEYEAAAAPKFFEKYLDLESFSEPRHYLLAYELQRRFFVRDDQGAIGKARNLASAIQQQRADFKPLRDQVHNQISEPQIAKVQAYRDRLKPGKTRDMCDELVAEIRKLTSLDESALRAQLPAIKDARLRGALEAHVPPAGTGPLESIAGLAALMGTARQTVEAKKGSAADRRRLVDLAITAAAVIQQRGATWLDAGDSLTARRHAELLIALANAAYGGGLLMERERAAAVGDLKRLLENRKLTRDALKQHLARAARVVEWAQLTTLYAFEEVRLPWTHLVPASGHIPDDVLRGSPLMVYATALERLEDFAAGGKPVRHELFGETVERDVRALNPGLAVGRLRVAPESGDYARNEVLALPETPADLEPAAGILTRGEGNVVSHVQLLARALGIPNAVLGPQPYAAFVPHDGERVFYISTPGGRVLVKTETSLTARDREVLAEYTRNQERSGDGALGGGGAKLDIDVERLDVVSADVIDLAAVRRKDSGIRCGPKAAFLGELKHMFPDKVARGVVVPFGAYYAHYRSAPVALPKALARKGLARAGTPLPEFVEATYDEFFGRLVAGGGADERALAAWIQPRLEIMRYSLERHPLSPKLREGLRAELRRQGLLEPRDPQQTVGLFVRSDTNVEDLENFNGAGLNLTLFNRRSLKDVYAGLKKVWASPFTYRSFSWRQTLIDEPLWVLPSVVILASVPTEKSGVLITADLDGRDQTKMLVATSEGVGGAVDGTPAETVVWSPSGVELVTMFKSPYRRLLKPGGSEIVASTGGEQVLSKAELSELVKTAARIRDRLEPSRDTDGRARPWDVEFGFADGKLWLFQARPFIGNDSLANVPALAAYEAPQAGGAERVSLDETVR